MGTPPQQPPPPQPGPGLPQQQGNPGIAVAGFVVGLIGLLASWVFVAGLIICIVGLVLSIIGRRQANERGAPTGLATAGLVCSIVGLVIAVIITVLVGILLEESDEAFEDLTFTTTTFNLVIGLRMLRGKAIAPLRRVRE
jgi:uncharacterized membrane protein